jgi:large subunit ribosomal protein L18
MNKNTSKRVVRRNRIKKHIRKRINGTAECPRLTVFRSLREIQAQLIDDSTHRTLLTVSSLSKAVKAKAKDAKDKVEVAKIVGKMIGEEAKKKEIETAVFDRSGYLYHGRVKAVADGAREGGLKF